MEQSVLEAFRKSTAETFRDMFGVEAVPREPRPVDGNEEHGWEITGLVGLAGQAQGVVAIRLTNALTHSLLAGSGVVPASEKEQRELVGGLVGEIANIVAGAATSALAGLNVDIAPPVLVRGLGHRIGWPAIAPVVGVVFSTPSGEFEVDLCVRS